MKQVFKFALSQGIIDLNPTDLLRINIEDDDEHGVPFTDDDLKVFWNDSGNDVAQVLLILCYSGYRIGELSVIDIDLSQKRFTGGLKTRTSKERVVPIHSFIFPLVKHRITKYGSIITSSGNAFREQMYEYLEANGIEKHTPHDCRHTFSRLCEKFKVNENDRKRMLGHKIGDITNDVYGHRSLEELREEIEKIKEPNLL